MTYVSKILTQMTDVFKPQQKATLARIVFASLNTKKDLAEIAHSISNVIFGEAAPLLGADWTARGQLRRYGASTVSVYSPLPIQESSTKT
jgi:hypothetical protein